MRSHGCYDSAVLRGVCSHHINGSSSPPPGVCSGTEEPFLHYRTGASPLLLPRKGEHPQERTLAPARRGLFVFPGQAANGQGLKHHKKFARAYWARSDDQLLAPGGTLGGRHGATGPSCQSHGKKKPRSSRAGRVTGKARGGRQQRCPVPAPKAVIRLTPAG
jgi:hypothetical protein